MLVFFIQLDIFFQRSHFAVDFDSGISVLSQLIEQVLEFALSAADDGGGNDQLRAFGRTHDLGVYCIYADCGNDSAAFGAVRNTYMSKQQSEVIVNFRDRADGRARVFAGSLLVNGNCRRQTLYGIDVGFFHLSQEHSGIAGKTFDITALTFGKNGVERKRRLARSRQARKYDEFIPWNGNG